MVCPVICDRDLLEDSSECEVHAWVGGWKNYDDVLAKIPHQSDKDATIGLSFHNIWWVD